MAKSPFSTIYFDINAIAVSDPIEKRALNYAFTLHSLFNEIAASKMPADRMLANYFREHKKHGSKDRRILRETLFSLFRWWGWLQKIPQVPTRQNWLTLLGTAAHIEQHPWLDIIHVWQTLGGVTLQADANTLNKVTLFNQCIPDIRVKFTELVPDWFWSAHQNSNPDKLAEILAFRPPIWARVQKIARAQAIAELQQLGINATASVFFNDALSLGHKSINLNELKLYQNGKLEIQDLASQVIGQICAPKPNELWWDACAGAGGKSLQLSSLMQSKGEGEITASDIRPQALAELSKRAKRAGFDNIRIQPWKSNTLPVDKDKFDGVLVDAPCSCTGTWRRNPDMRWLDQPASISDKPALQLDILSRACEAVKLGGTLVYATCSLAKTENEDVVNAFLAQRDDFEAVEITHPFTGEKQTQLTINPFDADCDGMFVAKLRRKR